ncbi:hypothetical protein CQ040_02765 [Microbacterium sp. MYb54]|nr:hypothetical protein CQ032_04065 [Microbacterium sp. MYb43]PQZ82113.1 hypothetical protein CQ031_01465 [Microbacterium sp. MYb40]PRB22957.1 hypothetical protein CQ037_18140 [Microbacterium sp. MYb50]PRB24187.1 hypothetical protein CQ040_02765 [Microbacterium sp. MYb54]PRB69671.1 hypothetical protein CQ021_02770 [Microbacterium sp. MYb24]PRB79072.1 hypothetical protein CQ027_02060 [Microbacterium sp. MYb32]
MLLAKLDPRDSRRVVIDVDAVLSAAVSRSFDLGIRVAKPDRAGSKVTLTLASDEALLGDFAQLVDDGTPRTYQASLRAVCDYVLGRVGGLAPNRAQNPRGSTTALWSAAQSGGSPTLAATTTVGLNVGGEGIDTFLRAQSTTTSTFIDIRGTAANNLLVAPLGTAITVSAWVRPSSITAPAGRVYAQQYDAGGVLLGTSDMVAAVTSGQFTRVSATVARLPLAVRVVPIFRITGTIPVGGRLDATGFVTEQTSRLGPYRDFMLASGSEDANVTAFWPITNLITNPSIEVNADGWTAGTNASAVSRQPVTFDPPSGFGLRWTTNAAGISYADYAAAAGIRVTGGRWYVLAGHMICSVASTVHARVHFKDQQGVTIAQVTGAALAVAGSAWSRPFVIARAPAAATSASVHFGYQATAAGQQPYVDAAMFYEGNEVVPYFDGATADTTAYDFAWSAAAHASASSRTPTVERPPESLVWRAGVSGMAFLEPLLKAAGLRLVCDERRRWTLRNSDYRADGNQTYRHAVNIESADETLSREDDAWFDGAVYEYVWTDRDGIEQRRIDTFALTANPTKVIQVEVPDTPYPGPGRAESIVRRAQGRGRTVSASAIPTWTERTDQTLSVLLEGTPIQTGIAESVRFDFDTDTVTVTSRTTDTPAAAWILVPVGERWIDSPVGGTWKNEVI